MWWGLHDLATGDVEGALSVVDAVEERRFTYREGSLVVCHRILSMKENEEKQREEEGEDRALNTSGV